MSQKNPIRKPATRRKATALSLTVKFSREVDGRWIADIPKLPGVIVYGETKADALRRVKALALRVIADELEEGERHHGAIEFAVA
jgi:predicted RNase H-like HicB family nuclease